MIKVSAMVAKTSARTVLAGTLMLTLAACASRNSAPVKSSDVYVSVDKPRHWTLDDAHYLLTKLQDRSREVKLNPLTNLDPNSFNSMRIEQVQSSLSAALSYDQLAGLKNEVTRENLEASLARQDQAEANLSRLEQQRARLDDRLLQARVAGVQAETGVKAAEIGLETRTAELNSVQTRLDNLPAGSSDAQRAALQERVDTLTAQKTEAEAAVSLALAEQTRASSTVQILETRKDQIATQITENRSDLSIAEPSLNPVKAPDSPALTQAEGGVRADIANELLTALKSSEAFDQGLIPTFSVSDRLNNQINAENELFARQLTQLRNEVGPLSTVVFLELPHSIHSADGVSNDRHVQLQWNVYEICTRDPFKAHHEKFAELDSLNASALSSALEARKAASALRDAGISQDGPNLANDILSAARNRVTNVERDIENTRRQRMEERDALLTPDSFVNKACSGEEYRKRSVEESGVVAWDLIPKTNAYNVSDFNITDRELNFSSAISLLTGIGAGSRYQRRKQLFEQFATQEVFATAYGQGASTFGWVMAPRPGTRRVSGGAKTTFAALIVPNDASVIRLETRHCIIDDRTVIAPNTSLGVTSNCQKGDDFDIPISQFQTFWIDEMIFNKVKNGQVATIRLMGRNFSPFQMQVLVNGAPLQQVRVQAEAAKLQQFLAGASVTAPTGYFEVGKSDSMILHLRMPDGFEGTPDITITSPGRSVTLNRVPIRSGASTVQLGARLLDPLFQKELSLDANKVQVADTPDSSGGKKQRVLTVAGEGFTEGTNVEVRAKGAGAFGSVTPKIISTSLMQLTVPDAESWDIVASKYIGSQYQSDSVSVERPKKPKKKAAPSMSISKVELVQHQESGGRHTVLLRLQGSNIPDCVTVKDEISAFAATLPKVGKTCSRVAMPTGGGQLMRVSNQELILTFSTASKDILLVVSGVVNGKPVESSHVISIPRVPVISSLQVAKYASKQACGATSGNETLVISGTHLDRAEKVTIGDHVAAITAKSETQLEVKTPKVDSGKKLTVKVFTGDTPPLWDGAGQQFEFSETACGTRPFKP